MNDILTIIKVVFSAIMTALSYLFGGFDGLLIALLFCIVADYITGVLAAIYEKKLNSQVGFKGIIKKVVILIIVALSVEISAITGADSIRDLVICFYIANEGISLLENAGRMDVPFLSKLKDLLEQLKDK
jgi:toxin secretion/phage lysis holin